MPTVCQLVAGPGAGSRARCRIRGCIRYPGTGSASNHGATTGLDRQEGTGHGLAIRAPGRGVDRRRRVHAPHPRTPGAARRVRHAVRHLGAPRGPGRAHAVAPRTRRRRRGDGARSRGARIRLLLVLHVPIRGLGRADGAHGRGGARHARRRARRVGEPRGGGAGVNGPETGLRTGELAAAAGVNAQTLRYYERRGLLAEPRRSLGGHRLYPEDAVTLLRVIKAAQRLGFTLDEVAELLEVTRARRRSDAGLQARAAAKLAEIDAKLADLRAVRDTLSAALAAGCDDLLVCGASPECPIPMDVDDVRDGGRCGC
ncbi:MerR family transcriptional regulator [Nocardia puris]|nr:MerR family transcriptional regulator [Nocardia puris]MBF6366204.1 MerR family transcriptional regulator [Nocardia puris]MBF6458457.1 MerR family transcriptional regulator [Nocardia puris]